MRMYVHLHVCVCVSSCEPVWVPRQYTQPRTFPPISGTSPSILPRRRRRRRGFISFFIPCNSSSVLSLSSTRVHLHSAPLSVSVCPSDSDICLAGEARRDAVNTAESDCLCKVLRCSPFLFLCQKLGEITQPGARVVVLL